MNSPQRRGPGRRTPASDRWWLAGGVVIAALYLGTVAFAWPFPIRLLYDGLVPLPPYRWVHPPPSRARDNQPALSGAGTVALGPPSQAAEVSTDDDQALATFPQGILAPRSGESSVKVTIVPFDPVAIAPAPNARRFDGNAYRIEARYAASGEPAVVTAPADVVLRYPVHATLMLRWSDPGWIPLKVQVFPGSQQALANTDRLVCVRRRDLVERPRGSSHGRIWMPRGRRRRRRAAQRDARPKAVGWGGSPQWTGGLCPKEFGHSPVDSARSVRTPRVCSSRADPIDSQADRP